MHAEFLVELGADDPVLTMPWSSPDRKLRFVDLQRHPELVLKITEAAANPPLEKFLRTINSLSLFYSAKCDVWLSREVMKRDTVDKWQVASYIDLILKKPKEKFSDLPRSFEEYSHVLQEIVDELSRDLSIENASAEFIVRRCYFRRGRGGRMGLFATLYVFGFGATKKEARQAWTEGLGLVESALIR